MVREVLGSRVRRVVVLALGGGGDVVTAAVLAKALERYGIKSIIASIAWERLVVDPEPGPLPLNCFKLVQPIGVSALLALPGCCAAREGRIFVPTVCRVAQVIEEPVVVLDILRGELGLRQGLEEACRYFACDAVIGVDVGGDVVAEGKEDCLWSPLADSLGLAALANCSASVRILAVHSPGADGELEVERVMKRMAQIAAAGGYLWARGLSRKDLELLERLAESTSTEASRVALEALKGYHGELTIRGGLRRVKVSLASAVTYFFDASIAYRLSPLAKLVTRTTSLEEARRRLNEARVYTELDFEEDVLLHEKLRGALSTTMILELKEKRLRELRGESP